MYSDADATWVKLLTNIVMNGNPSAPRGLGIRELIGYQTVWNMNQPLITIKDRELGYRFAMAESWWIMSGSNDVESIAPYSKVISRFSDNGTTFFGAYGPKIMGQLPYVFDALTNDKDTRQAVLTIWRESPLPSKDIPCTVSLQFIIRDHSLHCVANMRSSDAWLGVPYDVVNFSHISMGIQAELQHIYGGLKLGNLYLQVGSQHLYDTNEAGVKKALQCRSDAVRYMSYNNCIQFTCWADVVQHLEGLKDKKAGSKSNWLNELTSL